MVLCLEQPSAPRFPFYTDLELAAMPPQRAAIDGILYLDTLATIVARYESFKTFVALEMAFCMAVGAEYYGRITTSGAVLYLTAEGRSGIAKRVGALRAKYGGIPDDIPLVIHPGAIDVSDPSIIGTVLTDADRKLQEIGLAYLPIVAVFIDTLARNMSGDENDAGDMGRFVAGCDALRQRTGAVVVAVHHTGWEKDRSRGSIVLPSAIDTEITLSRDRERVTLKCTKQKDASPFADLTLEASPMAGSLVLEAVELHSRILTENEHRALLAVHDGSGLRWSEWRESTGLASGSLSNARNRLLTLGYVKQQGTNYVATDAGRLAIGSEFKRSSTEVQPCEP